MNKKLLFVMVTTLFLVGIVYYAVASDGVDQQDIYYQTGSTGSFSPSMENAMYRVPAPAAPTGKQQWDVYYKRSPQQLLPDTIASGCGTRTAWYEARFKIGDG